MMIRLGGGLVSEADGIGGMAHGVGSIGSIAIRLRGNGQDQEHSSWIVGAMDSRTVLARQSPCDCI